MLQFWLEFFVIVAGLAIILQAAILVGMFLQMREMSRHITRLTTDLQLKVEPILIRTNRILEDSQDRITSIVADSAEVVRMARNQAQKVDRVLTDTVDRLRVQVIRADQILTGALEVVEDTGAQVRNTLWGPINNVVALLKGLKTGLDVLRGNQRPRSDSSSPSQDEELFI
jgi:hypothetical protein